MSGVLLFFSMVLCSVQSNAMPAYVVEVEAILTSLQTGSSFQQPLNWSVGDTTDHKIKGGIVSGMLHSVVREETAEGFWVQQDADLGFAGKQKIELLYDKMTGEVLEVIINGEKKNKPNPSENQVVDTRQTRITVPKGTFDCTYIKVLNTRKNEHTETWSNEALVPIGGMIKTVMPSQIGAVTAELKDFRRL